MNELRKMGKARYYNFITTTLFSLLWLLTMPIVFAAIYVLVFGDTPDEAINQGWYMSFGLLCGWLGHKHLA